MKPITLIFLIVSTTMLVDGYSHQPADYRRTVNFPLRCNNDHRRGVNLPLRCNNDPRRSVNFPLRYNNYPRQNRLELIKNIDPIDAKMVANVTEGIISSLKNDHYFKNKLRLNLVKRLSLQQLSKDNIKQENINKTFTNAGSVKTMMHHVMDILF